MFNVMRAAFAAAAGFCLLAASNPPQIYAASLDDANTVLTASTADARYSFTLDDSGRIARSAQIPASTDFSTPAIATLPKDGTAPGSLRALVSATDSAKLGDDERCLATAVYYEAKGEPLEGQLAVAQVILNRVNSGRFAQSVCGVVYQPKQFSFANGGRSVPPQGAAAWRTASAIAKVAMAGNWQDVAPAALYFHADYVKPGWGKRRVSQVGNHIFYR